jgi:hypothetical protein
VDLTVQTAAAGEASLYWQTRTPQRFWIFTSTRIAQPATVQLEREILETELTAKT